METGSFILKNIENKKDFWKKIYNNFVLLFVRFDMGMCGGPVFSVSASRSPVPGSILGPGPEGLPLSQDGLRGGRWRYEYCTNNLVGCN